MIVGELPAVSRDKTRLRRPSGHIALSRAASLLTWSQSQWVMELEKVINPALQPEQDSSIKPAHKDSPHFQLLPAKRWGKLEKAALLSAREEDSGVPDPSSSYHLLLFLTLCTSNTVPELLEDMFSLFIWQTLQGGTLPENECVSQGLNERPGTKAQSNRL